MDVNIFFISFSFKKDCMIWCFLLKMKSFLVPQIAQVTKIFSCMKEKNVYPGYNSTDTGQKYPPIAANLGKVSNQMSDY